MPTVYGVGLSPFVRKVRVVLDAKGVAYDLDPVIPMNVSAEFKQISPLGKIPAFRDGERTLCDSTVICQYLERTHPTPSLYPSDAYDFARALWFEEYADTALVQVFGPKIFFPVVVGPMMLNQQPDRAAVEKVVDEELPPLFSYLENQLTGSDCIVGDAWSIADIGLTSQFVNLSLAGYGVDSGRWPKLAAYVATQFARPAFAKLAAEERAFLNPSK